MKGIEMQKMIKRLTDQVIYDSEVEARCLEAQDDSADIKSYQEKQKTIFELMLASLAE